MLDQIEVRAESEESNTSVFAHASSLPTSGEEVDTHAPQPW